jgi:hypothetical protein
MDYYPTDTVQEQQFSAQPNTEAPIVAVNPYQYQGQGNQYQWVSLRLIFGGLGAIALLVIGAIAMRSTAISTDQVIKVAPLQNVEPSSDQINKRILESSNQSLSESKFDTSFKLDEVVKAMLNERSTAILNEGKRQVGDRNSPCFMSKHQESCFIVSTFIPNQLNRYENAALQRKWTEANHALFEIKAARIALDGAPNVPFVPNVPVAAIKKEMDLRVSILQQSDNAIAAEMFGGKQ